jgi:hypothetical protein
MATEIRKTVQGISNSFRACCLPLLLAAIPIYRPSRVRLKPPRPYRLLPVSSTATR